MGLIACYTELTKQLNSVFESKNVFVLIEIVL